jgi:hypothetical protein
MDDWANLAVEGHFMPKTMVGLSRAFCAISYALSSKLSDEYDNN